MDEVATTPGNTPAVARRSYVDLRVVGRFIEGRTIRSHRTPRAGASAPRAVVEETAVDLLAGA